MTYIQRIYFQGAADIHTISVHKGQTVTFSGNMLDALRVALSEPDVADGRNYFLVVTSVMTGSVPYFSFVADDDMLLFMRPDTDTGLMVHIWVSGGSYHA